MNSLEKVIEKYSYAVDKWFRIKAFSCETGYFTTIFSDITHEKELTEASKAFLLDEEDANSFEEITQRMKRMTGAEFVVMNLFSQESGYYRTVAFVGIPSAMQKISRMLGFSLLKKKWKPEARLLESFKDKHMIIFDQLHELMIPRLPNYTSKNNCQDVRKTFNLGKTVMIKILLPDSNSMSLRWLSMQTWWRCFWKNTAKDRSFKKISISFRRVNSFINLLLKTHRP